MFQPFLWMDSCLELPLPGVNERLEGEGMNLIVLVTALLLTAGAEEAAACAAGRSNAVRHLRAMQMTQVSDGYDLVAGLTPLADSIKGLDDAQERCQKEEYKAAEKAFATILSGELRDRQRLLVRFLRARCLHAAGRLSDAAAEFTALAPEMPLLQDWCHYFAGGSHAEGRQHKAAATSYGAVSDTFPLKRQAKELTCIALYNTGNADDFLACAEAYCDEHPPTSTLMMMRARTEFAAGRKKETALLIREIRSKFAGSSASREAKELSGELRRAGLKKEEVKLTGEEKLVRAARLYDSHKYTSSFKIATRVADGSKKKSETWCRAIALQATSLARDRQQTKSMPYFEDLAAHCEPYLEPKMLFRGVDAARKAGKLDPARKLTDLLVARFPDSTLCDDALLYVARLYERKDRTDDMKATIDSMFAHYPSGDMGPEAAWMLVFGLYRKKDYEGAFNTALKFQGQLPARADYRTDGRLLYWMGRFKQKAGAPTEALPYFRQVLEEYPYCWYGLLSYLRLEEHKEGAGEEALEAARTGAVDLLPGVELVLVDAGQWNLGLQTAVLLLSLGMPMEARKEIRQLLARSSGTGETPRRLLAAFLYDRAGRYTHSHDILRRKVKDYRYTYPTVDDDRWWRVAYPAPYKKLARKSGGTEGVPWTLIMAVIREESGFNPAIESYAHALGLMQLLQKTASWIAGKEVSRRRLKIPRKNIPLGAKYLRYLLNKFNHPVLAVAGYNSGPGGVFKTLDRMRGRRIDDFVEHIPYDQTRRYTKRVVGSAWTYQALYGDRRGVVPFKLTFKRPK